MRAGNINWKKAALAAVVFGSTVASAIGGAHAHPTPGRRHLHHRHLEKRGGGGGDGVCKFPEDAGLVAVTPDKKNAGWAMAPDMPCKPGMYCPYACPPGQLMAQWDPKATTYTYPESMHGGLYCNDNGEIEKPFPERPYCVDGQGTVHAKNKASKQVSICQTVLPGYEDMLIPTAVHDSATLAVPGTKYWAGTSAHYYINPPGVGTDEACVWGTNQKPVGNWSPYVAGANQDASGKTYVTLGWNPIYLEKETPFRDEIPQWGVRITCDDDNCEGTPCEINPDNIGHKVNAVKSAKQSAPGAGGANFCVVGVPKGSSATIEVFDKGTGETVGDIPIADDAPGKKKQVADAEDSANNEEITEVEEVAQPSAAPEPSSSSTEEVKEEKTTESMLSTETPTVSTISTERLETTTEEATTEMPSPTVSTTTRKLGQKLVVTAAEPGPTVAESESVDNAEEQVHEPEPEETSGAARRTGISALMIALPVVVLMF